MKKLRLISILLAMALVFTLMPAVALADEADAASEGGESESVSDSVSDSADDPAGDSTDDPAGDSTDDPAGDSTDDPAGDSTDDPAGDSTDDPAGEPTDDPAGEPADAPAGEPTDAPAGEPTDAPAGEPTDAPAGEPTDAPADEPTENPAGEPTDAPASQPTDAPAGEPTDAPASQPTDAPAGQPTGEVIGEVVGEINAAQPVMATSFMAAPAAAPVAPVEPQPDKDATAEKNIDWANNLRVDFYLRLDDQQAINVNNGKVAAEAGQKPGEQTSSAGKNDYKTSGYTSVLATGKLGDSLAYYFAGGNGFDKYQSVLASDYNKDLQREGTGFTLSDFNISNREKLDNYLKDYQNCTVEWYVAKVYPGKVNVDGIIVPIKEEKEPEEPTPEEKDPEKIEEKEPEEPTPEEKDPEKIEEKEPEEPAPGDKEPVIIYDGGDDDGDNDDSYYTSVTIVDEDVPLATTGVESATTVFIIDEEVPLANLPQTGSNAAATAAAAGVAIIMLGAAMLCKKEN